MNLVKDNINLLFPLSVVSGISWKLIPELQFFYYLTPVLMLLFVFTAFKDVLQNRNLKTIAIMFLTFGIWATITSLWSDYKLFTLVRGSYFILLSLGVTSGMLLWYKTKAFSKNPFGFLLPTNLFVVVTGLISLLLGWPEDAWTGGNGVGFMGFFTLQLVLGKILLFTLPAPLFLFLSFFHDSAFIRKKNRIKISLILLVIFLNIFFVAISHSRAAFFSLSVGILLTLLVFLDRKQTIYFIGTLVLLIVIVVSNTALITKIEKYVLKGTSHLTANREILWGPSYEAATIGGLFGIGYGSSVKEIETEFKAIDNDGQVRREKGNGVLALIEEVGLFGLILFFAPIGYVLKMFFHKTKPTPLNRNNIMYVASTILFSFFVAFLVHSLSEAWMVGMKDGSLLIFLSTISLFCLLTIKPKRA